MDNTPCGCTLNCYAKVPEDQRQKLFDGFWSSSDFNTQNAYLCGCVKVVNIAKRYTQRGSSSRRSCTRVYYVSNGRVSVRICKVAFLRIHAVSNGRLGRALKAQADNGGSPRGDMRGRHLPANKTTDADLEDVKKHILSFPKYRSHYSRSDNPHRHYLSPDLSITKMYLLYKHGCSTPVSEWVYRKVFNQEFNMSFGRYVQSSYLTGWSMPALLCHLYSVSHPSLPFHSSPSIFFSLYRLSSLILSPPSPTPSCLSSLSLSLPFPNLYITFPCIPFLFTVRRQTPAKRVMHTRYRQMQRKMKLHWCSCVGSGNFTFAKQNERTSN